MIVFCCCWPRSVCITYWQLGIHIIYVWWWSDCPSATNAITFFGYCIFLPPVKTLYSRDERRGNSSNHISCNIAMYQISRCCRCWCRPFVVIVVLASLVLVIFIITHKNNIMKHMVRHHWWCIYTYMMYRSQKIIWFGWRRICFIGQFDWPTLS